MKATFGMLALAAGTEALVSRSSGCCFHLSAKGGPGGDVDQLSDGQNRIGQSGLPEGQYCIDSNGGLTDGNGRGCILTKPTTQWQCDTGATPTPGFSVGCDGTLSQNGNSTFWSCPTGDNGGYNIYSSEIGGEPGCVQITLTADSCKSGCPTASSAAPPAPTKSASACPANLPAVFEYPHLIIPLDSDQPEKAYTNSYNGTASGSISSVFNFDIPPSAAGKLCTLEFLFPERSTLETSSYTFSGDGKVSFYQLEGPAVQGTTYANAPKVLVEMGTFTLAPGTATWVATMECPANQRIGVWLNPEDDTCLNYFQDYNPCPIGLYMTVSS